MPTTEARPTTPRTFPAVGELALDEEHLARVYDERPRAFLELLLAEMEEPCGFRLVGDVGVVDVIGPLEQRGGWWWDGYDSVVERAREAFADPRARAVVLCLDSPGGAAAGNLAAARQLRQLADQAGKPLVAHAETLALSAAYALAASADRVTVTADGAVGSVGVIARVVDRTKANADAGLDVRVVRSGNLKADPHPDVPITDASVARVRGRVNELADAFAAWVGERRGRPAAEVLSLQGATVYAARAVEAGLADGIGTLAEAITAASEMAAARTKERTDMTDQQKMAAHLAGLRTQMGVSTDEELAAGVATLKQHAAQLPEVTRQRDEALAALAQRDQADRQRERAEVISRHQRRGALSEAMLADGEYMATLATLDARQLDVNLSRLPVVAHARVEPAPAPEGKGAEPGPLSQIEKDAARAAGLTEAEFIEHRAKAQKKG